MNRVLWTVSGCVAGSRRHHVRMSDFVTFRTFITPGILLFGYYFGAAVMPVGFWAFWRWVGHRYPILADLWAGGKDASRRLTTRRQRVWILAAAITGFVCMEVVWRMMFETMIAYFQMRDALMKLAS